MIDFNLEQVEPQFSATILRPFAKNHRGKVFLDEIATADGYSCLWSHVEREHMAKAGRVTPWTRQQYLKEGRDHWAKRMLRDDEARLRCGSPLLGHTPEDLESLAEGFAKVKERETLYYCGFSKPSSLAEKQLFIDVTTMPDPSEVIPDFDDLPEEDRERRYDEHLATMTATSPSPPAPAVTPRPMFVSATDLLALPANPAWLVKRLIEENTIGMTFGPSGGGKTFNILDLAISVATGTPWAGRGVKRGLVIYFAGEGGAGLPRRMLAVCKHRGLSPSDLSLLHISTQVLDIYGTEAVTAEIAAISEATGEAPAMVIIDTLARHIEGDENSAKDMGGFIKSVDSLRASFPGSVALIVHHSGHGETDRARGSSANKAAMDFEIRCDRGQLTFTKMKDGEPPEPIDFKLTQVVVGHDEEGEPVTSAVVEYGQRSERHQDEGLTSMERLGIKALINVSIQSRMPHGERWGALIGDWREAFYNLRREREPDITQNTLKCSFRETTKGMERKRLIQEVDNIVILTGQAHQQEIITRLSMPHIGDGR